MRGNACSPRPRRPRAPCVLRSYASDHISLCAEFEWELPGLASGWLPPRPRGEQDWD